jgi:hypothetical protein
MKRHAIRLTGSRAKGARLSVLSMEPKPLFPTLDTRALHRSQGPKSGVAAVFGRWPGDESDEEVEALLAEMS